MHYFLWLRDAPDLSYLDEWVREEARAMFGDDARLDEHQVEALVQRLNKRATTTSACECEVAADGPQCRCDCRAMRDANWWAARCSRWNDAWDDVEHKACVDRHADHPCTLWHRSSDKQEAAAADGPAEQCEDVDEPPGAEQTAYFDELPDTARTSLAALRNMCDRCELVPNILSPPSSHRTLLPLTWARLLLTAGTQSTRRTACGAIQSRAAARVALTSHSSPAQSTGLISFVSESSAVSGGKSTCPSTTLF